MNHAQQVLCLLALSCAVSAPARASCSSAVVDVGLVTTVTVTAGPNEPCDWLDENPGNSSLLSVAGVVVPALLRPSNVTFSAHSVSVIDEQNVLSSASCQTTGLVCAQEAHGLSVGENQIKQRYCAVDNESAALSATATCVYENLTP